jgi:hypothetical protein
MADRPKTQMGKSTFALFINKYKPMRLVGEGGEQQPETFPRVAIADAHPCGVASQC